MSDILHWEQAAFLKLAGLGAIVFLPTGKPGEFLLQDEGTHLRPPGGHWEKTDKNLTKTIVREIGEEFAIPARQVRKKIQFLGYEYRPKFEGNAVFKFVDSGLQPGEYQASNHKDEKIVLVKAKLSDPRYTGPKPDDLVDETPNEDKAKQARYITERELLEYAKQGKGKILHVYMLDPRTDEVDSKTTGIMEGETPVTAAIRTVKDLKGIDIDETAIEGLPPQDDGDKQVRVLLPSAAKSASSLAVEERVLRKLAEFSRQARVADLEQFFTFLNERIKRSAKVSLHTKEGGQKRSGRRFWQESPVAASTDEVFHSGQRQTETLCQIDSSKSGGVKMSNQDDLVVGDASVTVAFSEAVSSFGNTVPVIDFLGAFEKVAGINASWIITGMEHEPARIMTVGELPDDSGSTKIAHAGPKVEGGVTIFGIGGSFPDPAVIFSGLVNLTPKLGDFCRAQFRNGANEAFHKLSAERLDDVAFDFKPDFTPEEMEEKAQVSDRLQHRIKPRLASEKYWPVEWTTADDPEGWIAWYRQYHGGRQTVNDDRQIGRWLNFKARHGAEFVKNPTPRRAWAMVNWAIDPLKMLPEGKREAFRKTMDTFKSKIDTRAKSAGLFTVGECRERAYQSYREAVGKNPASPEELLCWIDGEFAKQAAGRTPANAADFAHNIEPAPGSPSEFVRLLADRDNDRSMIRRILTDMEISDRIPGMYNYEPDYPTEEVPFMSSNECDEYLRERAPLVKGASEFLEDMAREFPLAESGFVSVQKLAAAFGEHAIADEAERNLRARLRKLTTNPSPISSSLTVPVDAHGAPTTGPEAIQYALQNLDMDEKEAEAMSVVKRKLKSKRPDAVKVLGYIDGLRRMGYQPHELMLTKVPVLPPQFRPFSVTGDTFVPGDANELYRDLINLIGVHHELETKLGRQGSGFNRLNIYDAVSALYGFGDPTSPKTRERGVSGFLKQVTGTNPKFSYVQRKLLSKDQDYVARSVIGVDPDLGLDEIGVPNEVMWTLYAPYVQRALVRSGMSPEQSLIAIRDRTEPAERMLDVHAKERPVLYSRAPSWHKFNVIAGYPKRITGDMIRINPLVTTGLNADFDGDTLNVHLPSMPDSVQEAKDKLMPSKMLFSIKERDRVVPTPKQEFVLGAYNAQRRPAKSTHMFPDKAAALKAINSGAVRLSDEVQISNA